MRHRDVTRFLGKRVRVYQRSGEVFTGLFELADERLLRELRASGHIDADRVYQVRMSVAHPEIDQTRYMISDPATIARIEVVG